jgi:AraC-like DNA-binding protein
MSPDQRYLYVSNVLFGGKNITNADLLTRIQESMLYLVPIIYISQIFYIVVKSRKFIREYNKTIANFYSNIDDKTINWAVPLLYSLVVASLLSVFCSILGRTFFLEAIWMFYVPMTCFTILFFIAGYLGNIQNHSVANMEKDIVLVEDKFSDNYETVVNTNEETFNSIKLKEKLFDLFENKQIFTNADLKVIDLAQMLNTNRTYISNIINNELSSSFSKFVNQYRIQKAKELLIQDKDNKLSLEFVSRQVGFGTLHTFIRAFKESEGVTPGLFRENI